MSKAKKNTAKETQEETLFAETKPEEAEVCTIPEDVIAEAPENPAQDAESSVIDDPAENAAEHALETVEVTVPVSLLVEVADSSPETENAEPAEVGDVTPSEPEPSTTTDPPKSPDTPATVDTEADGVIKLTLSLPVSMFEQSPGSMQRLKAAISSKQTLLKKALATDSLDIVIEEDRVTFPWFSTTEESSPVDVDAYSKLVFALAKKAITQTRVDPVEKVPEDLQLGMRLYLINLNFKGDDFKSARAVLMKNFRSSGSGSATSTKYELTMPEVYKP